MRNVAIAAQPTTTAAVVGEQRGERDRGEEHEPEQVADDHGVAAVEPVGEHAGDGPEHQRRQQPDRDDATERRALGGGAGRPAAAAKIGGGEQAEPVAERGDAQHEPEPAERPDAQDRAQRAEPGQVGVGRRRALGVGAAPTVAVAPGGRRLRGPALVWRWRYLRDTAAARMPGGRPAIGSLTRSPSDDRLCPGSDSGAVSAADARGFLMACEELAEANARGLSHSARERYRARACHAPWPMRDIGQHRRKTRTAWRRRAARRTDGAQGPVRPRRPRTSTRRSPWSTSTRSTPTPRALVDAGRRQADPGGQQVGALPGRPARRCWAGPAGTA